MKPERIEEIADYFGEPDSDAGSTGDCLARELIAALREALAENEQLTVSYDAVLNEEAKAKAEAERLWNLVERAGLEGFCSGNSSERFLLDALGPAARAFWAGSYTAQERGTKERKDV